MGLIQGLVHAQIHLDRSHLTCVAQNGADGLYGSLCENTVPGFKLFRASATLTLEQDISSCDLHGIELGVSHGRKNNRANHLNLQIPAWDSQKRRDFFCNRRSTRGKDSFRTGVEIVHAPGTEGKGHQNGDKPESKRRQAAKITLLHTLLYCSLLG